MSRPANLSRAFLFICLLAVILLNVAATLQAQQQTQQQQQAARLRAQTNPYGEGVYRWRITPHWFADNTRFWYRNDLAHNTKEFIVVDVTLGKREPAFDHARLAAAFSKVAGDEVKPDQLPFSEIEFSADGAAIQFTDDKTKTDWICNLTTYEVTKKSDTPSEKNEKPDAQEKSQAMPADSSKPDDSKKSDDAKKLDASERTLPPTSTPSSLVREGWDEADATNLTVSPDPEALASDFCNDLPAPQAQDAATQSSRSADSQSTRQRRVADRGNTAVSPDKSWTATVRDNNIVLTDASGAETKLTDDGRDNFHYTRLYWSPDSATLVAFRLERGDHKEVYRVESSPSGPSGPSGGGVGRAVLHTSEYPLPGDKLDSYELNVFDIAAKKQFKPLGEERIDMNADGGDSNPYFGNGQYETMRWRQGGTHFSLEKYDRGHQRLRLIDVDCATGQSRNVIDEQSKTFIWTAHFEGLNLRIFNYLSDESEMIYASEMDGWRHLYHVDTATGSLKQITHGQWVVRGINRIDEDARQIWFTASGVFPDQDPYFIQYGRVNFDGTGLTWLTSANGNHMINFGRFGNASYRGGFGQGGAQIPSNFSPDFKYVIDTYSRVDLPPITELRRATDGQFVCVLEKADVTADWTAPEVFVAKGRDDATDIWGLIIRPKHLDPAKKYAIIEDIYAGPQDSFVPKKFNTAPRYQDLTDLGFIVVKIDGMGTANRSKAFHDVCFKNLKDAGFLDRIAWIKAAAKKYPYMDLDRVGIYGTSAGGQNAAAAVLFHPEFYKVAVANSGCHDNRMDKITWNEQWMGYPVGPQYAECSNINNAYRLQGRLQLVVGELDTNVPPESTYRFVDALVKTKKDFEFVLIPGANHGAASPITQTKLHDFFVRYLQNTEPPNHNAPPAASP